MTGSKAACADHMHVVVDGLAGDLCRSREERSNVDVEAEVGKSRSDNFGAPVVAVLSHLRYKDARITAILLSERLNSAQGLLVLYTTLLVSVLHALLGVRTTDDGIRGDVPPGDLLNGCAYLADRRTKLRSFNGQCE